MDLASVVAALASVGVRVSGSNPNNNIQGDSSRACPTGLAGPEPSGTHNDPGQHFHSAARRSTWRSRSGRSSPTPPPFADVLVALERQYPTYETDLSIRAEIQNLPVLPNNPKPGRVSELLADLDHWAGRLTPGSYSSDDLLFWLCSKLPRELWDECRLTAERKARSLRYEDLCVLLLEIALEKEGDQHLNHKPSWWWEVLEAKGTKGPDLGWGLPPNTPSPPNGEREGAILV